MDRRVIWAIALMMVIAIAPGILFRKPVPRSGTAGTSAAVAGDSLAKRPAAAAQREAVGAPDTSALSDIAPSSSSKAAAPAADTIVVTSPLYTYGVSTRGAQVVSATLKQYRSIAPGERGALVQLLPDTSALLGLTLIAGVDTVRFTDWKFTASAESLTVAGPTPLRLSAARGDVSVDLTYTFFPDKYQIGVAGQVKGVGPNGGLLLIGLGTGIQNTEADSNENHRSLALVTQHDGTERTDFAGLKAGESKVLSGPFEWAAVKSKYFVTAVLDFDSTGGGLSGVHLATPATAGKKPTSVDVRVTAPIPPSGAFDYTLYAGPLEYHRLSQIGHGFDDVNPYGWPGLRTLIRPLAVGARWLLVWMHEHLALAYGTVLIIFGVLVRLLLWPLNQKAMRASLAMQAVQPLIKDIQERHKNDPQRLQQEMFKLYKEHKVNPFGGCWPMLVPMPVLFALFFVFQNTIELRGASYLWLPDLARPDPLYIIPVLMGISMFGLSKVGQMGMEPNPQMKMMLYVMPVMMTVLFLNFASGLNLYYAVSNTASIPQQWLLARERMKGKPPKKSVDASSGASPTPVVEVKTKPVPPVRKRKGA